MYIVNCTREYLYFDFILQNVKVHKRIFLQCSLFVNSICTLVQVYCSHCISAKGYCVQNCTLCIHFLYLQCKLYFLHCVQSTCLFTFRQHSPCTAPQSSAEDTSGCVLYCTYRNHVHPALRRPCSPAAGRVRGP